MNTALEGSDRWEAGKNNKTTQHHHGDQTQYNISEDLGGVAIDWRGEGL